MEGGRKKHGGKKGSQWVGRVELSLFLTPKIFNDENLINVICVVHRYASSLLVTIISRTGSWLLCGRQQWEAAAIGSRSSSTPWAQHSDRWAAHSTPALPSPPINLPPGETWPRQPFAQKGLAADS